MVACSSYKHLLVGLIHAQVVRVTHLGLSLVLHLQLLRQVLLGVAQRLRLRVETRQVLSDGQILCRLRLVEIGRTFASLLLVLFVVLRDAHHFRLA